MRIPDWWAFLLLGLALYRLCRLLGWDDLTTTFREWLVGVSDEAHSQWTYVMNAHQKLGSDPFSFHGGEAGAFAAGVAVATGSEELPPLVDARLDELASPATPPVVPQYVPPVEQAHSLSGERIVPFSRVEWYGSKLIRCPWCLGWWLSLVGWICYQAAPRGTLIVASLLALSALPGLVTKNLDKE